MKKILIALLVALTVVSCQKKETTSGLTQQEVSFAALQLDPGAGLKSTDDAPECPTDGQGNLLIPTVAKVVIDEDGLGTGEQTFWPEVFMLDGKMYTQAIKLPVAESGSSTYHVTFFGLYTDTEANGGVLIMATPADGAPYAEYTSPDVDFTFVVNKFAKAEVPVQVLCFMEDEITNFGFDWFQVTELVVREQCFFGDICLNGDPFTPADFNGSLYGTDLGVDVPAIMQVRVYKDAVEDPYSPWNNESTLGIGAPLCVTYSDNINVDGEVFTFELYLWLPDANGFSYQLYATYTATDDGPLNVDVGDDGVLDFVVGSCNYSETDDEFDFLYEPPVPPLVVEGWESAEKKAQVRWRNFRTGATGWDFGVGADVGPNASLYTSVDWTYSAVWFFNPDYNEVTFVYDGSTKVSTTVVANGTTYTDYAEYATGDLGEVDYMQWFVKGDNSPSQTVEFFDVMLTVGGNTFDLGDYSRTATGTTWSFSNFDLSSGFTLVGKIRLTGASDREEHGKVDITIGDLP